MDWLDFFDMIGALAMTAAVIALGVWLGFSGLRKQLRLIANANEASAALLGSINHKLAAVMEDAAEVAINTELTSSHAHDIRCTIDQLQKGGRRPPK